MSRQAPARITRTRTRKSAMAEVSDVPEVFEEASSQDKLALMAVHAERRKSHPSGNIFGMYLGVAVCTILVLVGWVITLPKALGSSSNQKDGAIAAVKEYGSAFTKSFANDKPFENSAQLIENMKKQAESAKN